MEQTSFVWSFLGLKPWDGISFWTYCICNKGMKVHWAEDLSIHLFLRAQRLSQFCAAIRFSNWNNEAWREKRAGNRQTKQKNISKASKVQQPESVQTCDVLVRTARSSEACRMPWLKAAGEPWHGVSGWARRGCVEPTSHRGWQMPPESH